MASICQLYLLLTSHPGSFLDYSAWITQRTYSSSDKGPCPINTKPITEGLWLAKYIFDYVTPYLPETYVEHDISLLNLTEQRIEVLNTREFSKLVYLVNRHLILTLETEFSRFDDSLAQLQQEAESGSAGTVSYEQISNFERKIKGTVPNSLDLFLILCLATHASYNKVTQALLDDSISVVEWDEETEQRMVAMMDKVFPASLADPATAASPSSRPGSSNVDDLISAGEENEEGVPLLAHNGAAANGNDDDSDHPLLQKSFHARETYARVPLPKKNYKAGKNWVALGFQGANPTTDFRATGHLGLRFFESYCVSDPEAARNTMAESGSFNGDLSKAWYPVALVSIHMSLFIKKITSGRFLYRGLVFNLDLLSIYELTKTYAHSAEDVNLPELIATIEIQMSEALSNLHNQLVDGYHKFWRSEVKRGVVKTPLDVDASIIRFQESIQFKLFDGDWRV